MDSSLSRKRLMADDIAGSSASTSSSLPPCKYGSECYRKNPDHFANFSHPGMRLGIILCTGVIIEFLSMLQKLTVEVVSA